MDKIALLFAGQGAQYPGMGKDFYETVPAAAEVFDQLEQQRPGTMQQCFYGSKEELSITINTQPCLFAVDYAIGKSSAEQRNLRCSSGRVFIGRNSGAGFCRLVGFTAGFSVSMPPGRVDAAGCGTKSGQYAGHLKINCR